MPEEVDFLFDEQLVSALINLIRTSKHKLVLISPFIDFDARVRDVLNEKKELNNFKLQVLFGKNENNYLKSIKKDSLEFLKQFPDVEIRYNERLHAKFYLNDFEYIMTSLNLYDYSLANNIEVGVRCEYAFKGMIGKAAELASGAILQGVNKVKHDVIGFDKGISPIEKFRAIFEASELKYKTRPLTQEKSGLSGMFGGKKLNGFEVVRDDVRTAPLATPPPASISGESHLGEVKKRDDTGVMYSDKQLSASQLSKILGVQIRDITSLMQKKGFINEDKITPLGYNKGLVMKSYMGSSYIAYPENLQELNEFKMS